MQEKRSLFQAIFGTKKQDTSKFTTLKLLNNQRATFSSFNKDLYASNDIRANIDVIARNCAKLNPKHIRYYYDENGQERIEYVKDRIYHLITKQPNMLMNAYDFYYKIITQLELFNNAFVYIQRDTDGSVIGLYPINANSYQLLEYQNHIYVEFRFSGNRHVASLSDDVIHLKRFFNDNDVLGETNEPIYKVMSLKHIIKEGIANAIKTTQGIKGIIKSTKAMLKPEDVTNMRNQFVKDFIDDNGSGIGGLDATTDFKEVNINPKTASDGQIGMVEDDILNYFGTNKKILQSTFNEEEWNAFYESVIEGIALQLSLEFTNKIFTIGERWHGNEIVFEANRLQYSSNKTKIQFVKEAGALGILTVNEGREVFNLAPIDGGDVRMQSLNYTDVKPEGEDTDGQKE